MRRILLVVLVGSALLVPLVGARAQTPGRVEVVEVKGIIDANVQRSITATIRNAGRDKAELVVLQIDSRGTVGADRMSDIVDAIDASKIPVATWIGPEGARGENGAAVIALSGHARAIAPGASLGPVRNFDLGSKRGKLGGVADLNRRLSASEAKKNKRADFVVASVSELLEDLDGRKVDVGGASIKLSTDPDDSAIRFHKGDLLGRALHAAAQPSIVYLLLLLALVGIVFELFHPSSGPAGMSGVVALILAVYGMRELNGSWLGFVLIVVGVVGFCLDLRYSTLAFPSILGFIALTAGSLLLFSGTALSVSPWVLAFGIAGMVAFLLGAMTRVLRDLRALARGEIEVQDAHQHPEPHPNGHGADAS